MRVAIACRTSAKSARNTAHACACWSVRTNGRESFGAVEHHVRVACPQRRVGRPRCDHERTSRTGASSRKRADTVGSPLTSDDRTRWSKSAWVSCVVTTVDLERQIAGECAGEDAQGPHQLLLAAGQRVVRPRDRRRDASFPLRAARRGLQSGEKSAGGVGRELLDRFHVETTGRQLDREWADRRATAPTSTPPTRCGRRPTKPRVTAPARATNSWTASAPTSASTAIRVEGRLEWCDRHRRLVGQPQRLPTR